MLFFALFNLCQDHKRAGALRDKIWVLTDLIAGVRYVELLCLRRNGNTVPKIICTYHV